MVNFCSLGNRLSAIRPHARSSRYAPHIRPLRPIGPIGPIGPQPIGPFFAPGLELRPFSRSALLQSRRSPREGGRPLFYVSVSAFQYFSVSESALRPLSGSPSLPSAAGGEGRGEEASHLQSIVPPSDL